MVPYLVERAPITGQWVWDGYRWAWLDAYQEQFGYITAPPPSYRPTPLEWDAILRGLAMQLGLAPGRSLLCQLADAQPHRSHGHACAHQVLNATIAKRIFDVVIEIGFSGDDANTLYHHAMAWLVSVTAAAHVPAQFKLAPWCATREEWLAFDRGASAFVFDSDLTLSMVSAGVMAARDGIRDHVAVDRVHDLLANHVERFARDMGVGSIRARGLRKAFRRVLR